MSLLIDIWVMCYTEIRKILIENFEKKFLRNFEWKSSAKIHLKMIWKKCDHITGTIQFVTIDPAPF